MSRTGPSSREVVKALNIACAFATIAVLSVLGAAPASAQSRERECVSSLGVEGDRPSDQPALSGDGRRVAFRSAATNLVANHTNGVPAFTASANPVLGAPISLDAGNSSGTWSVALVLLGVQSASIPTRAGGTLLVDPLLDIFLPLAPSGGSIQGQVPGDPSLYGVSLFCQVLESDAGAAHGISFSPGLELIFGK